MTTSELPPDAKAVLHRYLREAREALLWKVEGLSEREARMPRTPTGTNLLGLVKHAATVEIGYFGDVFGRPWPRPEDAPWLAAADDPDADADALQAEFFATADESAAQVVDLYRQVAEFADATIEALPLDAPGHVWWWGDGGRDVTLHQILVHVTTELSRHAGHADILREEADGAAGLRPDNDNLAPGLDYAAFTAALRRIAEQFPEEDR
ncbi:MULTISPECIES: DinB family protein [unclassified Isoptericola]|uniref:DinB family protein n=1 Tax=unclassified Isoptericola TaxID=2623355 RepID=UPI0036479640